MHHTSLTRRDGLALGAGFVGSSLLDWSAALPTLAEETGGSDSLAPFQRFPRMVHEYYVDRVRRIERKQVARKFALETRADAEAWIADVRARIARAFAPMPKAKPPLNATITGVLDRETYTVEKIVFESRPRFFVTANLYLPKNRSGRVPGVIGTCGHSRSGKAAEAYQAFAQGLARLGTACLIYDPVGQGERSQYLDENLGLIYPGTTHEHNMAGNQMELVGEFLGSWRAWDGIRALDYLLSRPEIDPEHVGVTGNSGGGTATTWLLGNENRWTMGAPACFVSTWRRSLENELPQDNEQCPPRSLALGLDHDDYLAVMAPRPVVILAKEQDYFDVRGSEEAYRRLRHLYRLLGAEENVRLHVGPSPHGFSQENREAMYRFFNSITGASDAQTEPDLIIEEESALWCTENGQVGPDLGSRTVFSFTSAKAKHLAKRRAEDPLGDGALREEVVRSLRLPERDPARAPEYRILRARGGRDYPLPHYNVFAVETEPRMHALVTLLGEERLYSRPHHAPEGKGDALLWIADRSADAELRDDKTLQDLVGKRAGGVPVFACDVRGVGESLPGTTTNQDPASYYGADYFYAAFAHMLGLPYLGGKVHDVLRTLDFLASHGWDRVHLAGRGRGALIAGLAAFLDARVDKLTLHDRIGSWHEIATTEHYEWPLSHMLFGVLKRWDLPEVWTALEQRIQVRVV